MLKKRRRISFCCNASQRKRHGRPRIVSPGYSWENVPSGMEGASDGESNQACILMKTSEPSLSNPKMYHQVIGHDWNGNDWTKL